MLLLALLACSAPEGAGPELWSPGELVLQQVDLTGWIGASTLIVGPDGTSVLVDAGNDRHADDVVEAVETQTGDTHVDVAILTHWHADHVAGFWDAEERGLDVGTLVQRGEVGLGSANNGERDQVIGSRAWESRLDLCDADGCELPVRYDLGEGAWVEIFAAAGSIATDDGVVAFDGELPDKDSSENARSVAGVVGWGDFRYVFAGDLTGGGQGTPDMEGFYAENLPTSLVPERGADIVQLSHHGIDSSTNDAWVDRLLPDDGHARNAMVGSNNGYLDAPANEVLERVRGRLSGVWANRGGAFTGDDDVLHVAEGAVTVTVRDGGAAYAMAAGDVSEDFATVR
jgi:beta-lactamase superfamily II metal-dependent hydrolase